MNMGCSVKKCVGGKMRGQLSILIKDLRRKDLSIFIGSVVGGAIGRERLKIKKEGIINGTIT